MTEEQRETIKLVVRGLYDAQALRIQLSNRIARLIRDGVMTEESAERFFHLPFSLFQEAEEAMEKTVREETKDLAIVKNYLLKIKGIGPRLAGLLVANIADIRRFDNVAKLWAYAGLHVIDGRAAKRQKGQKANWNRELKTTAWKIAISFIRADGPYRKLYNQYKARILIRQVNEGTLIYWQPASKWEPLSPPKLVELLIAAERSAGEIATMRQTYEGQIHDAKPHSEVTRDDWTLSRIDNMAKRYTVKIMLAHLWETWRNMEGLPVREPYPIEYLGHTGRMKPEDFLGG